MTYEDAIICLKILKLYLKLDNVSAEKLQAEMYKKQTYDTATEALEKQIPKKPDYEADGYDNKGELIYDTWICPNCGKRYEMDYDHYDYCPKCGQRINWEETE